MRRYELRRLDLEPDERRRVPHVVAPEPIAGRRERGAGVGELERTYDATSVVRVHARRRRGIALHEQRVRPLGPEPVVDPRPALALSGRRRRRQLERRQCRSQVEAGAADDDRRATGSEDRVDLPVGEPLVLADGDVVGERHDPDESRRVGRRRREDRQARVQRRRVGRDDLGVEPVEKRTGDGGLAARGRAVDRDDAGVRRVTHQRRRVT